MKTSVSPCLFQLLNEVSDIGIGNITNVSLVIDGHQRHRHLILAGLMNVICQHTSSPALPFSLGSDGHPILIRMPSQRLTAEWIDFQFFEKYIVVRVKRRIFLAKCLRTSLKLIKISNRYPHSAKRLWASGCTFPERNSSKALVRLPLTLACCARVNCSCSSDRIRSRKALRTFLVCD